MELKAALMHEVRDQVEKDVGLIAGSVLSTFASLAFLPPFFAAFFMAFFSSLNFLLSFDIGLSPGRDYLRS
jgi:hypothetical protein